MKPPSESREVSVYCYPASGSPRGEQEELDTFRFEPSDQLRYSAVQVSLELPRRFSIDAADAPPVHEPPCFPEKFRREMVG